MVRTSLHRRRSKKSGYQIIAISPDKPESLDITDAKHNLSYQLMFDSDYRAIDAFGVRY
ncbi:redoxin domain-containing protein [Candidatus Pelagisphaera phototrophica]|nr:redoxin domain-containing protein [Candidatus Pelagisphaera phototrophica]